VMRPSASGAPLRAAEAAVVMVIVLPQSPRSIVHRPWNTIK
jgi:hypothetical protein